jgi:3-oxoacyl-(acyl-carrier-protein) synthase
MPKNRVDPSLYEEHVGGWVDENTITKICERFGLRRDQHTKLELMFLDAARQAIHDKDLRGKRVAIVIGCMSPDESSSSWHLADCVDSLVTHAKKKCPDSALEIQQRLQTWKSTLAPAREVAMHPDTVFGLLKKLNIHGECLLVDAACASSLAAVDIGNMLIQHGKADVAIVGGMESYLGPESFLLFQTLGALSPGKCMPFDEQSKGLCQGEGAVALVLEPNTEDHPCIVGVGASSDGPEASLFSPTEEGQLRALQLGLDPPTLLACHATGTPVGDLTEMKALQKFAEKVHVHSIKHAIGHTKATAGCASLLSAMLSLQAGFYPPSPYLTQPRTPNLIMPLQATRTHTSSWTCGVSAFGFGGINYHVRIANHPTPTREGTPESVVVLSKGVAAPHHGKQLTQEGRHGIPPESFGHVDPRQLQAVAATQFALRNAGVFSLDLAKVGVVSASRIGLPFLGKIAAKVRHNELKKILTGMEDVVETMLEHAATLPEITLDTPTGVLNNVIAGRTAKAFGFLGKNYNIDARQGYDAALRVASLELEHGHDMIVVLDAYEEEVRATLLCTERKASELNLPVRERLSEVRLV